MMIVLAKAIIVLIWTGAAIVTSAVMLLILPVDVTIKGIQSAFEVSA